MVSGLVGVDWKRWVTGLKYLNCEARLGVDDDGMLRMNGDRKYGRWASLFISQVVRKGISFSGNLDFSCGATRKLNPRRKANLDVSPRPGDQH